MLAHALADDGRRKPLIGDPGNDGHDLRPSPAVAPPHESRACRTALLWSATICAVIFLSSRIPASATISAQSPSPSPLDRHSGVMLIAISPTLRVHRSGFT